MTTLDNKCSLIALGDSKSRDGICYPDTLIQKFVRKILKKTPDDKIINDIQRIRKYMMQTYGCNDQTCWDKHSTIFKDSAKVVHIPDAGWDSDRLVYDRDIYNVFRQYEYYYNKGGEKKIFKYLHDWDHDIDLVEDDRERLKKYVEATNEYKYRSIVFSLWGKKKKYLHHWTCIFLYRDSGTIVFFDSNGDPKTSWDIGPVIELLSEWTGYKNYVYNLCTVQKDYSSCGIFTIMFTARLLIDKITYKEFLTELLEKMNSLNRDEYYEYILGLRTTYFIT